MLFAPELNVNPPPIAIELFASKTAPATAQVLSPRKNVVELAEPVPNLAVPTVPLLKFEALV